MIKVIKLVTGEEVIGDLEIDDGLITIEKPCALMLIASKSSPDNHSMALVPYAGYAKDHTIVVKENAIIWSAELQDDVYNQYNSLFGSGIQIMSGMGRPTPNVTKLNVEAN